MLFQEYQGNIEQFFLLLYIEKLFVIETENTIYLSGIYNKNIYLARR